MSISGVLETVLSELKTHFSLEDFAGPPTREGRRGEKHVGKIVRVRSLRPL